jgi:hypothetical protein
VAKLRALSFLTRSQRTPRRFLENLHGQFNDAGWIGFSEDDGKSLPKSQISAAKPHFFWQRARRSRSTCLCYGRGGGVGRGRDCGVDLGVGVALGVGVGVGVNVAVAVGLGVAVARGVAVGVPPAGGA